MGWMRLRNGAFRIPYTEYENSLSFLRNAEVSRVCPVYSTSVSKCSCLGKKPLKGRDVCRMQDAVYVLKNEA